MGETILKKTDNNKDNILKRGLHLLRTNTNLTIIVIAALLLEVTTAVMYYSAQNIIKNTTERLVNREMDAIHLNIRNKLAQVEVTVDNMAWVVSDGLDNPDRMYDIARQMVEHNLSFLGSGMEFVPNYYTEKGLYFEPYAVSRGRDSILSLQLGLEDDDYTQDEYFRIPFTEGITHWSEPYIDTDGAKTLITTYSVPIYDTNKNVVGVVYADISLDWLEDMVEKSKLYNTTQRFLVTAEGHLLVGKNNATFKTAMEQLKKHKDHKGYLTLNDENNNKFHLFFQPMGGKANWLLINLLNDKEIFGHLRNVRLFLLLLAIAGLLLIGFIVWRYSRHLKRLQEVSAEKNRINGELKVANEIQQSMLPQKEYTAESGEWRMDICGFLAPAREVGGDLFDYFIRDEKLFFCIGDVSGKGAASAMVMGVSHTLFRAASAHESNPAHIMQTMNETACDGNKSNMFLTFFIGVLDLPTGRLRYCDAGHECPFIVENKNGKMESMECNPHLPLGVFDDVKYEMQETKIQHGNTLFLYTDGLTEAKNKDRKQFGIERIKTTLFHCIQEQLPPKKIIETMNEEVKRFVGDAEQSDDLTMLTIHYTNSEYSVQNLDILILKNEVSEVTRLSDFMKSVTYKLKIKNSLGRQLRLAVEEAVVNVINYAFPAGTTGEISVKVMILSDGETLNIQIIDAGVPFDPTAKEKTDTSLSAEDRQIGGLGILLVRELMDTINYERNEGKNILTLVKKIKRF